MGYGAIGLVHADALNCVENAELVAVCDINEDRLEKAHSEYGVPVYKDFDDLLNNCDMDCIHICTPHYLHKEMVCKALKQNIDVVLEKPVCINEAELCEIKKAYEKSNSRLCVMLQNRLNPCICEIKKIIKENSFGKILGINGYMTWRRDEKYYQSDEWRGKLLTEGGGVLINQGIHLFDLMVYINGEIKSLSAGMSQKFLKNVIEVEDTLDALIQFKNGVRGSFYITNSSEFSLPNQIDILFEKGRLRYADGLLYEFCDSELPRIICEDKTDYKGKYEWGCGHQKVLSAFYGDEGYYPVPDDTFHTMDGVFMVYKSAKLKKEVML